MQWLIDNILIPAGMMIAAVLAAVVGFAAVAFIISLLDP
jgi:hypothetical protein